MVRTQDEEGDLERAVLVWEHGKVPDDILEKVMELGIQRAWIANVAAVPADQIMQHGLPGWVTDRRFGKER